MNYEVAWKMPEGSGTKQWLRCSIKLLVKMKICLLFFTQKPNELQTSNHLVFPFKMKPHLPSLPYINSKLLSESLSGALSFKPTQENRNQDRIQCHINYISTFQANTEYIGERFHNQKSWIKLVLSPQWKLKKGLTSYWVL